MVAPILLYGSEVWGYEDCNVIETLHLEFCKYVMRVKKTTPNCIVYGELGRMPMSIPVEARMIGFWEHILNGKKKKYHILCMKCFINYILEMFIIQNGYCV